ncbi:MAG TPA: hypothetical protein DCX27_14165 [Balneola sp.]|nr:hypothetical protein [Balneola sp.]|tara:strand:- start:612 stop:866 length:255 start_codon:yes stop_codon:yes gene_type:complete
MENVMKNINLNENFTHQNILNEIQKYCIDKKLEYIDGVVSWCEQNKVEVELIAGLIKKDPVMMSKLQYEAEELNILEKPKRLPL